MSHFSLNNEPITDVVILGASIDDQLLASPNVLANLISSKLGHPVTVYDAAVGGASVNSLLSGFDGLVSGIPAWKNNARTLAVIHIGGNEVSNTQPFDTADAGTIASMKSGINSLIDRCVQKGWRWVLADLTFRNYDDNTYLNEEAGSLPYNQQVTQAIIRERRSPYRHPDGRSWMDFYYAVRSNWETWLQTDDIHLTATGISGLQEYVAEIIAHIESNVAPLPIVVSQGAPKYNQPKYGLIGATAVVLDVYKLGLFGAPIDLYVSPAVGVSLKVEYSTDNGATYLDAGTSDVKNAITYTRDPGENWVTHFRITRVLGTALNSTYNVRG